MPSPVVPSRLVGISHPATQIISSAPLVEFFLLISLLVELVGVRLDVPNGILRSLLARSLDSLLVPKMLLPMDSSSIWRDIPIVLCLFPVCWSDCLIAAQVHTPRYHLLVVVRLFFAVSRASLIRWTKSPTASTVYSRLGSNPLFGWYPYVRKKGE